MYLFISFHFDIEFSPFFLSSELNTIFYVACPYARMCAELQINNEFHAFFSIYFLRLSTKRLAANNYLNNSTGEHFQIGFFHILVVAAINISRQ